MHPLESVAAASLSVPRADGPSRDVLERSLLDRSIERPGIDEAFVVRSGERLDLYARGTNAADEVDVVVDVFEHPNTDVERTTGRESVAALDRIATGTASGRDPSIGRLRLALRRARRAGALSGPLERALRRTIRAAEARSPGRTPVSGGIVDRVVDPLERPESRRDRTLGDLRRYAQRIERRESERALRELDPPAERDDGIERILEGLAGAIAERLLLERAAGLGGADGRDLERTLEAVDRLFDLDGREEDERSGLDGRTGGEPPRERASCTPKVSR